MEAEESRLVPGYRLDRYELLCPIASGGMASVWLARLLGKHGFEKLFAIKTIRAELLSDAQFERMFLDEARIASRIVHPNVAQILELGEQDDVLYIVMEWVDGDSLAKVSRLALKAGAPLPPGVSLRILADTCAGLHAAHQLADASGHSLGVVHRDVSPQNVLVASSGMAKVIDFGLVKAHNRAAGPTASGVVKGKIRYMAPEQVANTKAIDHRADVWAAGMCLYELLTGHLPYHDEEDLEVVKRLMSAEPAPRLDVALPPPLEELLKRALAREPAARFESAAAMRRAIESAIHELELAAEGEDVAAFLKGTLPDLGTKRSATVAKAIAAADARHSPAVPLEGLGGADIAFAKTEVSSRDRRAAETVAEKRRAPRPLDSEPEPGSSYGASRTTGVTTLRDQLGDGRRRGGAGYLVAAFVAASAGVWLLWPREEPLPVFPDPTPPPASAERLPSSAPDEAPSDSSDLSSSIDASDSMDTTPGATEASDPVTAPRPARGGERTPDVPTNGARAPAPTYNPAWSILTSPPPDAGLTAPGPSSSPNVAPEEPPSGD